MFFEIDYDTCVQKHFNERICFNTDFRTIYSFNIEKVLEW